MANDTVDTKKDEAKEATKAAIMNAKDFIAENGKKVDGGINLTRSMYYDYMKKNEGLSREVVDSVERAQANLLGGCDVWNSNNLEESLKDKDINERDINTTSRVTVQTPSGILHVTNTAGRVHNVPVRPGEASDGEKRTTTRYNTCTVSWKKNLCLDKELRTDLENSIRSYFEIDD